MNPVVYADISDIHKDMLERGYTPTLIVEKLEGVQPMSKEEFEAAHTLMKWRET